MAKPSTTPQHLKEKTRGFVVVPQALKILTRKARSTKIVMQTLAFWRGDIFLVFNRYLPLICFFVALYVSWLKS